ncbi:acyltransferase family protein [Marinoscillum sp.]|uniref:acyltransferase family protein n=1 Tax=Marinoscillum sp. TaxID=2024838 RepID=UPI003BAB90E1
MSRTDLGKDIVQVKRIDVLDGLRGLAVLIVFFSHTSGREQSIAEYVNFLGIGHIGVYLFFTMSAFLLGIGILSKPFTLNAMKSFFIKRALRVVPVYYIVVTGVFLVQVISTSYSPKYLYVSDGLNGYLEHLYFYRGDGVFWSIVSEIQFYLIVPIIGWVLLKPKGLIILSFLALLNFTLYIMFYANLNDYLLYFSPNTLQRGTFIDVFLLGFFAAYLVQFKKEYLERKQFTIHILATVLFLTGGVITLILVSKNFLGFNQPLYGFRYLSILFGLSFSLITVSLYMNNPWMNSFFKLPFLRFIGQIGFSFYLLHMAVFEQVNRTDLHHALKFFLSFILISLISYISYILIEKPSIKLSYRLLQKLKPAPTTSSL